MLVTLNSTLAYVNLGLDDEAFEHLGLDDRKNKYVDLVFGKTGVRIHPTLIKVSKIKPAKVETTELGDQFHLGILKIYSKEKESKLRYGKTTQKAATEIIRQKINQVTREKKIIGGEKLKEASGTPFIFLSYAPNKPSKFSRKVMTSNFTINEKSTQKEHEQFLETRRVQLVENKKPVSIFGQQIKTRTDKLTNIKILLTNDYFALLMSIELVDKIFDTSKKVDILLDETHMIVRSSNYGPKWSKMNSYAKNFRAVKSRLKTVIEIVKAHGVKPISITEGYEILDQEVRIPLSVFTEN